MLEAALVVQCREELCCSQLYFGNRCSCECEWLTWHELENVELLRVGDSKHECCGAGFEAGELRGELPRQHVLWHPNLNDRHPLHPP